MLYIHRSVKSATIRIDEALLKTARRHNINVSEAARAGIQDAIRRHRMLANVETLRKMAVKPVEPTLVTLRRLRDG